jgi:hypothetical protein
MFAINFCFLYFKHENPFQSNISKDHADGTLMGWGGKLVDCYKTFVQICAKIFNISACLSIWYVLAHVTYMNLQGPEEYLRKWSNYKQYMAEVNASTWLYTQKVSPRWWGSNESKLRKCWFFGIQGIRKWFIILDFMILCILCTVCHFCGLLTMVP